ncbi:MAG: hypothetical protein MUC87_19785 [Bacteroidia bacterium]|jgi:hypothetical protein|nr:hypothetical protein [Bacteroidia bacterium]
MRLSFAILFFLTLCVQTLCAKHELIVRIAHGSRPHPQHRDTEIHWLGGMYGGHVVIELDSLAYGFNYNTRRVHIFPRKKERKQAGVFERDNAPRLNKGWQGMKMTSVYVPLSDSEYVFMKNRLESLHGDTPFDYAFFGMRCASTAYMLLSEIAVFEKAGKIKSMRKAFHPKALRKRLLKAAAAQNLKVEVQPGNTERIWEGDRKKAKSQKHIN